MANVWTPAGAAGVKHEVDPISRIEGHLGVKVSRRRWRRHCRRQRSRQPVAWLRELPARSRRQRRDHVRSAHLRRLPGSSRHDLDATRSTPSSATADGHITFKTATEGTRVYGVPEKAVLIRNLVLGAEFLMSSITHFYHLAAPSYVQGPAIPPWTPYFDNSYYAARLLQSGGAAARCRIIRRPRISGTLSSSATSRL